ncbi:heparinase II/III family protein [Streptomyces sp. NPDC012508]|uniref:heparinase II/III domain-containing protein n=1 Tax=Streptomyces sp. NPDC012508 TaxID=3364837 RepID=UPI003679B78F
MRDHPVGELYERLMGRPALPALSPAALRAGAGEPHHRALLAAVRREAARAVKEGPQPQPLWSSRRRSEETGDRLRYDRPYFARRRRLAAFGLAAVTCDDEPVVDALADMLWSVCDEYSWALPAHDHQARASGRDLDRCVDLFSCETAHTLAEIVTLLDDRLPPPVVDRVRADVRYRVLDPLFTDPRPWPWESYTTNWSAVCGGAAGMAALALESDPARLAEALHRTLAALRSYLDGLGPEGGCAEGVAYWTYGFGYFTYFAEALRERTDIDLFLEVPKAVAAAAFPARAAVDVGRFVNFSDSDETAPVAPGLLTRLRDRCAAPPPPLATTPAFDADPCYRWAHLSRTLAWTDPTVYDSTPPRGTSFQSDLGWLVDRRAVNGVQVVFAAKGGHNAEPHNHNDLGHFILYAGGEQLLADLGAGEYRDGYFGPARYTDFLHPSSRAHSVPVVNGAPQREGPQVMATILHRRADADGCHLALDLSPAYPAAGVRRSFDWRDDATLTLTDTFDGADEVEEVFMSRLAPAYGPGSAVWSGHRATVTLRFATESWEPTVDRLDTTTHDGAPDRAYRLRLRSTGASTARAEFRFAVHITTP